jgi:hypothetical protein
MLSLPPPTWFIYKPLVEFRNLILFNFLFQIREVLALFLTNIKFTVEVAINMDILRLHNIHRDMRTKVRIMNSFGIY